MFCTAIVSTSCWIILVYDSLNGRTCCDCVQQICAHTAAPELHESCVPATEHLPAFKPWMRGVPFQLTSNIVTSTCMHERIAFKNDVHTHTIPQHQCIPSVQAARRQLQTEGSAGCQALVPASASPRNHPPTPLWHHLLKPPLLACSLAHNLPPFQLAGHCHWWTGPQVVQIKHHALAQACCLQYKRMDLLCLRCSRRLQDPAGMVLPPLSTTRIRHGQLGLTVWTFRHSQ